MGVRLESGETLLGRFELLQELGGEGRTRLWLAEDRDLGETVALRVLDLGPTPSEAAREQVRKRMREVCRETRQLAHPHILRVYDFHTDAEACLISREYVTGTDIGALADRPHREIVQAILSIVEALEYAHEKGVIHGDLRRSKIVGSETLGWRLADFGLSRALHSRPEVELPPSPREDVVALGVLLGELMGGAVPGKEDSLSAALKAIQLRMVDPACPDSLQSMRAVRAALVPLGSPTQVTSPAPPARDETQGTFETIRAVPFRIDSPGAASTSRRFARHGGAGWGRWTIAAFGLLVATALGVFFYLPHWVESRREQVEQPSGDETTEQARVQQDEEVPEEHAAATAETALSDDTKRLLVDVITAYDGLRARGAELWGPSEFDTAKGLRVQGENALQARDTERAARLLRESLQVLDSLERRQPEVVAAALEAGEADLAKGMQRDAESQFALALRIDPENVRALKGTERAGRLDEVLALTRAGTEAEGAGDLLEARSAYHRAAEIDPLWAPATEGLARVEAELAETTYKSQMARAVRAVAEDDLSEARTAYQAALEARPDSNQAREGLAYVDRVSRSRRIAHHRRQAEIAEGGENWERAAEHYRAVLDLDKEATFASTGLERSRARERLMKRMTHLIDHPEELYDPATRSEARDLLTAVDQLEDTGPRLEQKSKRLSDLLSEASKPIRVVIESDNQTQVTLKRVGQLGTFTRREVLLQPGTYVVLGIRRGYRDVLQTITVVPGQNQPTVRVICTEEVSSVSLRRGVWT